MALILLYYSADGEVWKRHEESKVDVNRYVFSKADADFREQGY